MCTQTHTQCIIYIYKLYINTHRIIDYALISSYIFIIFRPSSPSFHAFRPWVDPTSLRPFCDTCRCSRNGKRPRRLFHSRRCGLWGQLKIFQAKFHYALRFQSSKCFLIISMYFICISASSYIQSCLCWFWLMSVRWFTKIN